MLRPGLHRDRWDGRASKLGLHRDPDEEWRHRLAASQGSALRKNRSSRGWAGPWQIHSNRWVIRTVNYLFIYSENILMFRRHGWWWGSGRHFAVWLPDKPLVLGGQDDHSEDWARHVSSASNCQAILYITVRKMSMKACSPFIVYYYLNINYQIKQ